MARRQKSGDYYVQWAVSATTSWVRLWWRRTPSRQIAGLRQDRGVGVPCNYIIAHLVLCRNVNSRMWASLQPNFKWRNSNSKTKTSYSSSYILMMGTKRFAKKNCHPCWSLRWKSLPSWIRSLKDSSKTENIGGTFKDWRENCVVQHSELDIQDMQNRVKEGHKLDQWWQKPHVSEGNWASFFSSGLLVFPCNGTIKSVGFFNYICNLLFYLNS